MLNTKPFMATTVVCDVIKHEFPIQRRCIYVEMCYNTHTCTPGLYMFGARGEHLFNMHDQLQFYLYMYIRGSI